MDDVLKKIKETENESKKIIDEAQKKADEIVETARSKMTFKLEEQKRKIIDEINLNKDREISDAKIKRETVVIEKTENYKQKLGKVDDKIDSTVQYIFDYMITKLSI